MNNTNNIQLTKRSIEFLARKNHAMLIGGKWCASSNGATLAVHNPADESLLGSVPAATEADVDTAVGAARQAFESAAWGRMRPDQRQRLLLRLADLVEEHAKTLAEIESLDNGKSVVIAEHVDVALVASYFRYMAGWATKIEGSTLDVSIPFAPQNQFVGYTRKEPIGVVGAIVAWNFPLLLAAWKLGPALATLTVLDRYNLVDDAWNEVVAGRHRLHRGLEAGRTDAAVGVYLGQLIQEAGFPDGVVNVVTGDGPSVGAPLTRHPGVNKLTFTGSTDVGKLIGKAAMDNMTRITLELGGKSPVIGGARQCAEDRSRS